MRSILIPLFATLATLPQVIAWGAAGHEIVATIAQIHLHPDAQDKLCEILPPYANCHLAPVAAWADKVRMYMPWSGPLHYVNGKGDHPSQKCVFGDEGWQGVPGRNLLAGIRNTTMWLEKGNDGAEEALKFLIHFLGDMHQPLHLAGRDRGGNDMKVKFDKRITNLHSVWDSRLIAKSLRTIPRNYTRPLPYKRVEAALRGTIYDPYVRQIMHEGILNRFAPDIDEWISCPVPKVKEKPRSYPPSEWFWQLPLNFFRTLPVSRPKTLVPPADEPPTDDEILCPYAWAHPLHQLNCDLLWPAELDDPNYASLPPHRYLELDTPEYSGRIKDLFLVEQLLAMGGIRLAAILNYLFIGDYALPHSFD